MTRSHLVFLADEPNYILYGVRLLSTVAYPVQSATWYRKVKVGVQKDGLSEDLATWDNSVNNIEAGGSFDIITKGTRPIRADEGIYVATESINALDNQFEGLTVEVQLRHVSGVPRHRLGQGGRDALDGIGDYIEVIGARDRFIAVPLGMFGSFTPPVWDDLTFPAQGINPPGAASDPTRNTTTGRLEFAKNATNTIVGQAQLKHGWVEGTVVLPHIHYSVPADATTDILVRLEYRVSSVGDDVPSWTTIDSTITTANNSDTHLLHPLGEIPMDGHKTSCIIEWKFSRMGSGGGDTYDDVLELWDVDFHYMRDALGSTEEYVK